MRISDWSSDVCSSDLPRHHFGKQRIGVIVPVIVYNDAEQALFGVITPNGQLRAFHFGVEGLGNNQVAQFIGGKDFHRHIGFGRSEEHTSELQSLMRISYAVFCLKKKKKKNITL